MNTSPHLVRISGSGAGRVYPLDRDEITIGRDPQNDICLSDEGISRRHARIYRRLGLYWLEDSNSINGTCLQPPGCDPFRLTPGKQVLLIEGAHIHLASVVTLEARGLVTSQDEATRQTLAQLQNFVSACYEQIAQLPDREREAVQARLHQFEQAIHAAQSEAELVRLANQQLSDLSRTVVCASLDEVLPDLPEGLPEPGSSDRLPSLHNLFLSRLRKLVTEGEPEG